MMKIIVIETYDEGGQSLPSRVFVGNEYSPDPVDMMQRIQSAYAGKVFVKTNRNSVVEHIKSGSSTDIEQLKRLLLSQGYLEENVVRVTHVTKL